MPPHQHLDTELNGSMINSKSNGVLKCRNGSVNNNMEDKPSEDHDHVNLKKRVGLLSGVALIVGTMIGSGIFISPKGVLAGTGSVGLSLVVWVGCGLLSLCGRAAPNGLYGETLLAWVDGNFRETPYGSSRTSWSDKYGALSYAELGTIVTKSGAEYAYLKEAFGPMHKTLGPIPAFLFAWTSVLILKPALFGVVSMSFALYTTEPFFSCGPPEILVKMMAIVCLLFVSAINCYSVKLATKVQNFFTVAKLIAIAVITIGGFYLMGKGNVEELNTGFKDSIDSPSMIALAFYDGLWAYDGWNNLNYVTEEIRNPNRNLPLAIMIGIPLVTICYLFTNISYLTVMTRSELLQSAAVAATWGDRVLGAAAVFIPISVALSTFGAANGSCFTGGRVMYVAAREGHLPKVLSYVHVEQFTPLPSLLVSTFLAGVMVLMGDIFALIDFFSFAAWMFYGSTMAALLVMRRTHKDVHRPYKVPIILPIIVLLASIYLVIAPILNNPRIEFLYAFIFMFSGLFLYVPFVVMKKSLPFTDSLTRFLQLVLWCAPSKYDSEMMGD